MGVYLKHNAYGKVNVRLVKVNKGIARHDLFDISVDILLEGELEGSYLGGDNSSVVPTDTVKNTVYALAKKHDFDSIEAFGLILTEHFLGFAHLSRATATLRERLWTRIPVAGGPHTHAFDGASRESRKAVVNRTREGVTLKGSTESLSILKTTGSAFRGYIKDEYTTLKEATDRPFGTSLTAVWHYESDGVDFNAAYHAVRKALLTTFALHDASESVQQTLYLMGERALEAAPAITEISLTMPNEHRLLVDLSPFGLDNDNEIFLPIDEPSGMITGTVARG